MYVQGFAHTLSHSHYGQRFKCQKAKENTELFLLHNAEQRKKLRSLTGKNVVFFGVQKVILKRRKQRRSDL